MFDFDRQHRSGAFRLLALLGIIASGACDDPTATRTPPGLGSMTLFLILDPDAGVQPLLIKPAETRGDLHGLAGEVSVGGATVAAIPRIDGVPHGEWYPCAARYGAIVGGPPRCLTFSLRPQHGVTYRVSASADGYPTASGTTTVPGDFRITHAEARGELPGTGGLQASWTASAGTYRYVVAVRPASLPRCVEIASCEQGWFVATQDTTIQATVPGEALAGGGGPWHLDVYAVDRPLFLYLTTGTSGNLFPVGAVQNVQRGFGAVGSWVHRSRDL